MILEIPTADDFSRSSLNLLNHAWTIAAMLVRDQDALEEDSLENIDQEENEEKNFWHYAQTELANAYTLMQQAQEMALKGLISKVSPYLLISDSRNWPRQCEKRDILFSEFYTVDATN